MIATKGSEVAYGNLTSLDVLNYVLDYCYAFWRLNPDLTETHACTHSSSGLTLVYHISSLMLFLQKSRHPISIDAL